MVSLLVDLVKVHRVLDLDEFGDGALLENLLPALILCDPIVLLQLHLLLVIVDPSGFINGVQWVRRRGARCVVVLSQRVAHVALKLGDREE